MYDKRLEPLYSKRGGFIAERVALLDKVIAAGRGLTAGERLQQGNLAKEIETMDELIKLAKATVDLPRDGTDPGEPGYHRAEGDGTTGGFMRSARTEHQDLGSFVRDVAFPHEARVLSMGVGAGGGFLIPEQLASTVSTVAPETMVISARATTIPAGGDAPDAAYNMPALDQTGGILGGLDMSWLAEGGAKPETEPAIRQIKLEPQEIAGFTWVTDKLLRNGGAGLNLFLSKTLGNALGAAQEQAFLTGTGIGQPLGIIGSPATINVARGGAGLVAYADLVNMIAVFGPDCYSKGFWLISQSALPQIMGMVDPGAAGTLIFTSKDMRLGTPPSIMGLPVYFSTRTPVLGATGDVLLLEPSYYLRKLGSGPTLEASTGPRFQQNQTCIKIWANVDGQPWLTAPLLMEDGVTQLSPFVALAA